MSTQSVGCSVLSAAALLAWTLLPLSAAAAPAPPDKDTAVGAVQNPREALDRVVTLKLDRQTLGQAVAQISEKAKLRITFDAPALQQLNIDPNATPISGQTDLKEVKTRAALRTLLAPYNLAFVMVGDSVLVTSEDMAAARQLGQRVSVHLDKVEFAAALKQIARDTGVNLPLDPRAEKEATAKVSLDADDVPLETAVRLLAEMAGLKPVRAANTLFVTKKEIAAEMRADADLNPPPPKSYMDLSDRDVMVNALIWQAQQGRMIVRAPVAVPISVPQPIQVKQTEETPPANPDSPPAPEKKDGDK